MSNRHVTDEEINLLVDGELSSEQRVDIQARLAKDPARAADYFAELDRMYMLRQSHYPIASLSRETLRRAESLGRRLWQRKLVALLRTPVAAAALVAVGWAAGAANVAVISRDDAKVADENFIFAAREALRVAQLDAGPARGSEPTHEKIERLVGAMNISMPPLPNTWTITDVQVQPWHGTQSLVITANTQMVGQITLVAAPMKAEDAVPLTMAADGRIPTVYWQSGGTAYALISSGAADRLEKEAKDIEVATRKNASPNTRG
jgi:anti-sigma factor RsiW